MRDFIEFSMRVSMEQWQQLQRLTNYLTLNTGGRVSMAEIIRRAIADYLPEHPIPGEANTQKEVG